MRLDYIPDLSAMSSLRVNVGSHVAGLGIEMVNDLIVMQLHVTGFVRTAEDLDERDTRRILHDLRRHDPKVKRPTQPVADTQPDEDLVEYVPPPRRVDRLLQLDRDIPYPSLDFSVR